MILATGCPDAAAAAFGYSDPSKDERGGSWICWYVRRVGEYQLGIGVVEIPADPGDEWAGAEALSWPGADAAYIDDDRTSASGPCFALDIVVGKHSLRVVGGTSRDETIAIAKKVLSVG